MQEMKVVVDSPEDNDDDDDDDDEDDGIDESANHEKTRNSLYEKSKEAAAPTSAPWKLKLQAFVDHPAVVATVVLIIVADLIIAIFCTVHTEYEDVNNSDPYIARVALIFNIVSLFIVSILLIEILLRLCAAMSVQFYFKSWLNSTEFAIVIVTFVFAIVDVCLNNAILKELRPWFRVIRFLRLAVKAKQTYDTSKRMARHQVGMNKKRYQGDGFDLDLCYITDRIIAMSVPAVKNEGIYRNPLSEVVRFLNTKHNSNYKIYNLCQEREYPTSKFLGQVERWVFEDHSVPSLETMPKLAKDAHAFFDQNEKNVVAVHCKGGKGRTGTMICAILLYEKLFPDAEKAQHFFAEQRTDLTKPGKLQGVETASQLRWIWYYDQTIKYGFPPETFIELTQITIHGVPRFGLISPYCWWNFTCVKGDAKEIVLMHDFQQGIPGVKVEERENSTIVWTLPGIKLRDNTMMEVHGFNEKGEPADYFFFWFHAAFVKDGVFRLAKKEVDKCKGSSGKAAYKALAHDFFIELRFNTTQPQQRLQEPQTHIPSAGVNDVSFEIEESKESTQLISKSNSKEESDSTVTISAAPALLQEVTVPDVEERGENEAATHEVGQAVHNDHNREEEEDFDDEEIPPPPPLQEKRSKEEKKALIDEEK